MRVYFQDTDAGGVVYHASYVNFMERARTEWLRTHGYSNAGLMKEFGVVFVVRSTQAGLSQAGAARRSAARDGADQGDGAQPPESACRACRRGDEVLTEARSASGVRFAGRLQAGQRAGGFERAIEKMRTEGLKWN